jgi:hypothetical protein
MMFMRIKINILCSVVASLISMAFFSTLAYGAAAAPKAPAPKAVAPKAAAPVAAPKAAAPTPKATAPATKAAAPAAAEPVEDAEAEEPAEQEDEDPIDREISFMRGLVRYRMPDYAQKALDKLVAKNPEAKARASSIKIDMPKRKN